MPTFYKLNFEGSCQGQNIVNILYYGQDDGSGFLEYDEDVAQDILDSAGETFAEDFCAALPTSYTLDRLRVTSVNERGVSNSPYDLTSLIAEPGIQGGALSGVFNVAILPFTTSKAIDADRNLKRSYLAYGPVAEPFIDAAQALDPTFLGLISPFLLAVVAPLGGGIQEYRSVRVARTTAPNPIGVGVVRSMSMDAYSSTRKSRKKSPRGT